MEKEYNELSSPYIAPFLNVKSENGEEMLEDLKRHKNHQYPLSPKDSFEEGKTLPYSLMDKKFYGRR